jgi:hypothetical protein
VAAGQQAFAGDSLIRQVDVAISGMSCKKRASGSNCCELAEFRDFNFQPQSQLYDVPAGYSPHLSNSRRRNSVHSSVGK